MNLPKALANRLRLPGAPESVGQMNSLERFNFHKSVLERKPAFRRVIVDIQQRIWNVIEFETKDLANLPSVEIGSGVIPLRDLGENVISTDIEAAEGLQCVASAMEMPFASGGLRAVVAQNVLHHIPDPDLAMGELVRVLAPGGVAIFVEPYFGRFASMIYPSLFASEGFDLKADPLQQTMNSEGNLVPNQGMSFMFFEAGKRKHFENAPDLFIVDTFPLKSGLRYLTTGALNFRTLAPIGVLNWIARLENQRLLSRVFELFAIHWVIVVKKVDLNG